MIKVIIFSLLNLLGIQYHTSTPFFPLFHGTKPCQHELIFSSLAFWSPEPFAASFSSLALLSSSVATANLCCLLAISFSSLESGQALFVWFSVFSFSRLFLSLSFLCSSSVSGALFALSLSFLSKRFFSSMLNYSPLDAR